MFDPNLKAMVVGMVAGLLVGQLILLIFRRRR